MNRRLKKLLIVITSLYVLVFIGLYFLQEKMIFMPDVLSQDYSYSFPGKFEEVFLKTEDGAKLNALHFKAENSKGVVLYFHGNAGELSRWGIVVQKFVERQYDVLVMDYRTYGKSIGKLGQNALYSDSQLFYNYLLKRYNEEEIVIYGRSLGTNFATYVAAENHPKRLILEAPFYSLDEVARKRFPIYPVSWFLKFHFPTHQYLKDVSCPITIFHGTDDFVVDYRNGEKLSKIKTKGKLTFITIPGGTHHDLNSYAIYKRTLDSIL